MHLPASRSLIFATLSLLTSLTSALPKADPAPAPNPDPTTLTPRACTTMAPSHINILQRGDPTNPHRGLIFNLARSAGPPPSNEFISVVTFHPIPAGATGCMLQVEYPPLQYPNQIALGPAVQADVWSVAPDAAGTSTWANPPARDQFVTTMRFPTEAGGTGSRTVLTSDGCDIPTMSWLFEYSNWQQGGGSVRFFNSAGGDFGVPDLGFSLVFNC